jgi:hypothetical protein
MSLPKDYSKALHRQAGFYAAWFPVTVPIGIGDYGLIQNGVFNKIGHLDDLRADGFNVQIRTAKGAPTSIDFLSEGARTIRAVAGAEVPTSLPVANVEAKITYEFDKKNSFVVKASEINVEQMQNIREVADELARLRRQNKWSHSYRVVSATYTGQNCLVLLSSEAGTKVEFVAAASALQQLDLGNVEISPSVSFSSNTILRSIGSTGPIGLSMFKLTRFLGNLKVLAGDPLTDEERNMEEDWGDELEDDDL